MKMSPIKFGICTLTLMASAPAWAYLDPSTGSMVISAIVGLFASLALALKTYWYKLKRLFRRGGKAGEVPPPSGQD